MKKEGKSRKPFGLYEIYLGRGRGYKEEKIMETRRFYEDANFLHQNTLPPRAHYIPYDSLEKALAGEKEQSDFYRLLNGQWYFAYFPADTLCPDVVSLHQSLGLDADKMGSRAEERKAEAVFWEKREVPFCWQSKGVEPPYYTNLNYPYPVDPPFVPTENPVGLYHRRVWVEETEAARLNYLVFEGVAPCLELYVNGTYVGFYTVSHCTSEFPVVFHAGENDILVKVYKWCAASYLEDQDFFRCNGIFRDVYWLSRPAGHVFDIGLSATTEEIFCDKVTFLEARTKEEDGEKTAFQDEFSEKFGQKEGDIRNLDGMYFFDGQGKETDFSNPILWNAENPYLYTVIVKKAGEFIPFRMGLRSQQVTEKGQLLINGQSIKLRGVNHHDTHPTNGYVQTKEELKQDLLRMKELNINTIRTSHYPPQPVFLELCNELGFYVVDEADLETHGFATRNVDYDYDADVIWPARIPMWQAAVGDRAARHYQRDKNVTCVVMFSLGNESNFGENLVAMSGYIKKQEANRKGFSRLVHYEGAQYNKPTQLEPEAVDVVSRMYWTTDQLLEYFKETGDKRPGFWAEYCHAMGNGPGDIWDYWKVIEANENLIGGCIWEWTDHVALDENGRFGYGGDFHEETHDGNFCCDGLTFADRSFKAGSLEVKRAYQPMEASLGGRVLSVTNLYDFRSFEGLSFAWKVEADGNILAEDTFYLMTPARETTQLILPLQSYYGMGQWGTYFTLQMLDEEGREVAFAQFDMDEKEREAVPVQLVSDEEKVDISAEKEIVLAEQMKKGELKFTEKEGRLYVEGPGFSYVCNLSTGYLEQLNDLLASPLELGVWRAPTDNDRTVKDQWMAENFHKVHNRIYSYERQENALTFTGSLAPVSRLPIFRYELSYLFREDGEIQVTLKGDLDVKRTYLPRLGFSCQVRETKFSYFGYGPQEAYVDMHHGARMGRYHSRAEHEYVPYMKPQEHGSHYNTKELSMGGFSFTSKQGFSANVSQYTTEELEKKAHGYELEPAAFTQLRLDYKVSGLGSNSCGPELSSAYQLKQEQVVFSFTLRPGSNS